MRLFHDVLVPAEMVRIIPRDRLIQAREALGIELVQIDTVQSQQTSARALIDPSETLLGQCGAKRRKCLPGGLFGQLLESDTARFCKFIEVCSRARQPTPEV